MSTETPPAPSTTASKPRSRRIRQAAVGVLVLLAGGLWFAPAIVANTPLRNSVVRAATADLRGSAEVGGASLGWFSPVELRDVIVRDADGKTLLASPKITVSKSLFALLRDPSDLGEVAVERPTVELVCEKGTTNLETALTNYLNNTTPAGPSRTGLHARVTDGKLTLRDAEAPQSWQFEAIHLDVIVPRNRAEPVAVTVAAAAASGLSGKLDATLSLGESGSAKLVATSFPLDSLAPFLSRAEPGLHLGGRLTANLAATWGVGEAGRDRYAIEGTATAQDFRLAGAFLKNDQLRLTSAELPLKLEATGRSIRIERAELTCDVGKVSVVGQFDPDSPAEKFLNNPGVDLAADVDLARLAGVLPKLLRIREGTTITAGRLTAKLASRATAAGTTWDGNLKTTSLRGVRDGKAVVWEQPLAIDFIGRMQPDLLPVFDSLTCTAEFGSVTARGGVDNLQARADVSLDKLAARLADFIDLNGYNLSGQAIGWIETKQNPRGEFQASVGLDLTNFGFATRSGQRFPRESLKLRATANGLATSGGPIRLDNAAATVTAGEDQVSFTLFGRIPDVRNAQSCVASAQFSGELGRWMSRVGGFVVLPNYKFGGVFNGSGVVRLEPSRFSVDRLTIAFVRAQFRGAGLIIDEPNLSAIADLNVDRASGKADFARLQINSAVLTVNDGNLSIHPEPNGAVAVGGGGNTTTDLTRLSRAVKISTDPNGADALRGRGTGAVRFRNAGDTTTFVCGIDIKDFTYGDPRVSGISEPSLRLEVDGKYDGTPDRLTFAACRVIRPGLAIDGKGTFAKLDTTQDMDLSGNVVYDFDGLTPDLRASLGNNFQARGRGSKPFRVVGSLSPAVAAGPGRPDSPPPGPFAKLEAEGGIGWEFIKAFGFDVGQGELTGKLANGNATFGTIRPSFAGTQLVLTPRLRLDPEPSLLTFAPGKIVDRGKLSPAACAGALGYALPVIANASQTEGELTAVLDENRIPLGDFTKVTMKGQLIVHKATISAGPVINELSNLLGGPPTRLELAREMTVPIEVKEGKVFHRDLAVNINGTVIRTSGSVSFGGELDLVAELPIPVSLIKNNPRLVQALTGKTIAVPVKGTLSRPMVNPAAFQTAARKLVEQAVLDLGRGFFGTPTPPKK